MIIYTGTDCWHFFSVPTGDERSTVLGAAPAGQHYMLSTEIGSTIPGFNCSRRASGSTPNRAMKSRMWQNFFPSTSRSIWSPASQRAEYVLARISRNCPGRSE